MTEPPPPPLTFDDNISTIAAIDYTVTPPATPPSSNNPKRKRIKSPFFKKRKGGSASKSKSVSTPKTKNKKGANTPSSLTELERYPSPRQGSLLDLGKSSQALEQEHANLVQMLTPLKDLNKLLTEEDHTRDQYKEPVSQTASSQRSAGAGADNGNGAFKVLQAGVLNRKHRRQFRNKSKSPPTVLDSHNTTTLTASIASPPLDTRSESPLGAAMLSWSTVGPRSSSDASIDIGPSRSGSSSSSEMAMTMTQNDWDPMTASPERRTSARERRSFPESAFDPMVSPMPSADSETMTAAGPKRRLLKLLEGAFSKEEEDKDKDGEDNDDDERETSANPPRNSVLTRILGKGGTDSNFNSTPAPNLLSLSEFTNLSDQERLEAFESMTQFASQTYTELNDKQSKVSDLNKHVNVLNQQVIKLESMNENSMQNQNLLEKEMEKLQEVMKGCAQSLEAKVQFLEEEKEELLQQVQQQQKDEENKQVSLEGGEEEILELRQELAEKKHWILTLQRDLEVKAAETELKQEEADILKKEIEEHRITYTNFQQKTYSQSKDDQGSSKIDTGRTSNPNADEEQSELRGEATSKTRSLEGENEKEPQTQDIEEEQQTNAMSMGSCGESDTSTSSDDFNNDARGVANDKEDGENVKEQEQEEYDSTHKVMEADSGWYETIDIEGVTNVKSKGNVDGQQYENIPRSDQSYTADSSSLISPEATSSSCEETSLSSIPSGEADNVLNTSNQNDSVHIVLSHEQTQEVNEKQEQDADDEMQESRQTAGDKLKEDPYYPKQIDSKSDEGNSNTNVVEDNIPTESTEAINSLESDILPSIDASKSLDSGLDEIKQRNHSLDIKMPVGTTRASVAIAAARAMKNTYAFNAIPKGFSYMNLQGSTDHVVSKWKGQKLTASLSNVPSSPLSEKDEKLIAQLRDKRVLLEDMERSYKLEITKLTKEKDELRDKRTLVEDMERSHTLEITKLAKEKDELCIYVSELEEKNNTLSRTLNETDEGTNLSTANILAEVPIIDGSELHKLREENVALCKELKTLKDEIESVNGLLEETMNAVKDDKGQILSGNAVPLGKRGVLGRFSNKTRISSHHSDEEVKQLERICKVHHHTIMHQRSEMQVIQKEREALLAEVRINEEKISAFEKQFIEFNKEQEQKRVEIDESIDQSDESSLGNTGSEVIDQAYVSSLECKSDEHLCTIEELQNQLKVVKEQNNELRKEADAVERLKEELVCVNTKLQAKEMTISELEKCYESSQNLVVSVVSSSRDDKGTLTQEQGDSDVSFASSGEQISDADLSEREIDTSVLNLHKVTVLQEMQDAAIRRLDLLLSRISERTIACSDNDEKLELMLPLCEKLSIMQDYVKVSLYLLEGRLTNEIESARSGSLLKMDDAMQVRFDRIHDLVQDTESQIKGTIKELGKEVQHQDIKISAKDTVIEGLILSKTKLKDELESAQTEIDIFKGLQSFSSVNIGVMSRFKECSKLEEKLKEKDEIINHLMKEIDEN